MISLESMRDAIKNPSNYGFGIALVGGVLIFLYSLHHALPLLKEKEEGQSYLTLQLSALVPPQPLPIAEEVKAAPPPPPPPKPKPKTPQKTVQAPPKPKPAPLIAVPKPEPPKEEKQEQEEIPKPVELPKEPKPEEKPLENPPMEVKAPVEAEVEKPTTVKPAEKGEDSQNIAIVRLSEGVQDDFARAIRTAIDRKKRYPNLARQRGYEDEVPIRFLLSSSGEVSKIEVLRPSKYEILNKDSIKTIQRAAKGFPRPKAATYIEISLVYKLEG